MYVLTIFGIFGIYHNIVADSTDIKIAENHGL